MFCRTVISLKNPPCLPSVACPVAITPTSLLACRFHVRPPSLSFSPSFLDTLRNRLATPIQTMMYASHHHAPLFASVRACPNHVEQTSRRNGINLSHCGLNTPRLSPSGPLKSEGHQKEHVQARHHPPQRPHPLPLTHDLGNPIT